MTLGGGAKCNDLRFLDAPSLGEGVGTHCWDREVRVSLYGPNYRDVLPFDLVW